MYPRFNRKGVALDGNTLLLTFSTFFKTRLIYPMIIPALTVLKLRTLTGRNDSEATAARLNQDAQRGLDA